MPDSHLAQKGLVGFGSATKNMKVFQNQGMKYGQFVKTVVL